ncbi:Serine/threonine-protein kinase PknB [Rubripirellula tenax]|uniref:non-specific serine/threonine protein kinase n=1 Tax=Rubripirellula tenax TaxID=2528015 RepID=A0A5C6FIX7_9BACT|nr:serine/threonine-protein kinase [Rubripirellula tenax]TWU60009.1 Serine/threonine-protein kinase PknB [Rubripirellula tenax]
MIAPTEKHFDDELLRQLLDETLPPDRSEVVQSHLSHCEKCCQSLQRLAASDPLWDETIDVLRQCNTTSGETDESSANRIDVDWLVPILQPTGSGMGMLDRYPVTEVIGQGGMGVVLKAHDRELNRPVAVKVLSPHLAGVGAARARFMREAQAAAAIVHPSIVPIYSVVPTGRLPYLVMPLIKGGNLQQRIDREGPIDLIEIIRIAAQVADGLAAAHRNGVIHRDIKPANVLIEETGGRILISDFGLARALNDASLTCSGMIAGTPQYMSPEQARGDAVDARSDLFSLGSLMYALSTGRPPFRADNPLAILKKITESSPTPIHQVNERMPAWLNTLVGRLMTIQPNHRIATAEDAGTLLRSVHAHLQNPSVNRLPSELTTQRTGLRRGAAVAAIAVIATTTWWGWPVEKVHQATVTRPPKAIAFAPTVPDELQWIDPRIDAQLDQIMGDLAILESQLNSSPQYQGSE